MDSSNFPPLADRPEEQEEQEDGVEVSVEVINVMSVAAEHDLTLGQYLELAQDCLSVVMAELLDEMENTTATIAKLEVAWDIIAQIDLDPEEEGEDNED